MATYQNIKSVVQWVSFFFSVCFNTLLVYLIITKSPKKMGNYRYLMIYFSCFAIFFSTVDVVVGPYIHSYGKGFCIMTDRRGSWLETTTEFVLICVLCGCFGVTITFFAIHFVFRFFALERKGRLAYFHGFYLAVWLAFPVFFGGVWGTTVGYFLPRTEETTEYLRQSVLENYNLAMEDVTYIGTVYWRKTENGDEELARGSFISILIFASMIIVSFSVVCYYGYLSYQRITSLVGEGESSYTKNLQKQLYKALVVQAIIPTVLMYIPVLNYLVLPVFNIHISFFCKLVTIIYAVYPAIDPLPLFFIIDNYRSAVVEHFFFCFIPKNRVSITEDEPSRERQTAI